MSQLWTEKFSPKNPGEFIGNSEIVEKSIEWAKKWERGEREPPLLLWGQTGAGKTCLAYMIAQMFKWDVVELNSSDLRSKDAVEKIVGPASQNASFFGQKRMILLDEVDALSGKDRGGASAISSVIKGSKNPIVLTATDIFAEKSISALRFMCRAFEFKKINYLSMAKRLGEILAAEKIPFEEDAVKELCRSSSGDMRSALLDLHTLSFAGNVSLPDVKSLYSRERQQKVFSVMKAIFKGTSFGEVREARSQSDLSSDMLFRWVEENIPRQYQNLGDAALAFDRLSRADVFNGRIYNKQHWGFLRYSTELAAEGVALSKEKPSNDFVMYQFPGLLSMLSKTAGLRNMKKELGFKIGAKTHSSSRKTISADLPYIKQVFAKDREKAVAFAGLFALNEKEVAFLLGTSPDTKKVQGILQDAGLAGETKEKPEKGNNEKPAQESASGKGEIEKGEQSQEDVDGGQPVKQTKLF